MPDTPLQEITDSFGLPSAPKNTSIPKERVVQWMASDDLETLGALHAFLSKGNHLGRVSPSLSREDLAGFAMRYFEKCLRQNQEGEWAHGRYAAAWDIASWFGALWKRGSAESALLDQIKDWLAKLYKGADAELKRCIVDGALEHMFENKAVRTFFAEWKADPELATAFAEATEWSTKKP